ncbi:MAG: protein translocase subunit SecF [Candidatus Pacebacteria bacterium]|nr:protein translocase subunit SecF [Candidatus Paceibacterota bacterium]
MNFNFIKYSKIYFLIGIVMTVLSVVSIAVYGLKLGIDFEGGSSIKVEYQTTRPSTEDVQKAISSIEGLSGAQIQPVGQKELVIKVNQKDLSNETYGKIITEIKKTGDIIDGSSSVETISALVGKEMKDKTLLVVLLALVAMLVYIFFAFKSVSYPISSLEYGLVSTVMLFHDVVIPVGVLALLGNLWGAQLTIPVVTALLTIVGYCINNTVVVFDRIRENINKTNNLSYEEIVNKSINETFSRCVNTSLTVLFALTALYYFFANEESLKYFTITMGIGVFVGIFSSVFLAGTILVWWQKRKGEKKAK